MRSSGILTQISVFIISHGINLSWVRQKNSIMSENKNSLCLKHMRSWCLVHEKFTLNKLTKLNLFLVNLTLKIKHHFLCTGLRD